MEYTVIYDDIPGLWSVYDEDRLLSTGHRTKAEAHAALDEHLAETEET